MTTLRSEQIAFFKEHGHLVVRNFFEPKAVAQLPKWIDELCALPLARSKQMVYLEEKEPVPGQRPINRIEKFVEVHAGLNTFLLDSDLPHCVSQLLGEPVVLFKEKVNFQPAGGGGIAAHQDVQAGWLTYAKDFISVAITVDESNELNGCTEIDMNWRSGGLIGNLWEPLSEKELTQLKFEGVPTKLGDVIFFDGFVPHRAPKNRSAQQRRIMFVTYNAASQGDHREQYYADKRASFPPDNERDPAKEYKFRV